MIPHFIAYEIPGSVFVVGDDNRVDVQFLGDCDSRFLIPLRLFVQNYSMVRMDCLDGDRQIWVRSDVRRDGLEPPDVFGLDSQPSVAIRQVRNWCADVILAAAG